MIHYPRPYLRATAVSIYFSFSLLLMSPILAPYIKSIGLNNFELGALSAIFSIVTIFSAPLAGALSDSGGRKKVISAGILFQLVSIIIYYYSNAWLFIAAAKVLDALAFSTVSLVSIAAIQDHLKKTRRGEYTGISLSLQNVGDMAAPVAGGLIAHLFFPAAPFVVSFFLLAILCFYMIVFYREKSVNPHHNHQRHKFMQNFSFFFSNKKLLGMGILGMAVFFASPAIGTFLSVFAFENLKLSYLQIGYVLFALGFLHLFQFYFGKLSDKFGCEKMILLGLFLEGIGTAAIALATNFATLFIIVFLRGFGGTMFNVASWAFMSDIGEKLKKEGEVIGTYISLSKISQFASFFISGYIADAFGFPTLFIISGIVTIAGVFVAYKLISKK